MQTRCLVPAFDGLDRELGPAGSTATSPINTGFLPSTAINAAGNSAMESSHDGGLRRCSYTAFCPKRLGRNLRICVGQWVRQHDLDSLFAALKPNPKSRLDDAEPASGERTTRTICKVLSANCPSSRANEITPVQNSVDECIGLSTVETQIT